VFRRVVTVPAQTEGPASRAGPSCSDNPDGGRSYLFCHYWPFAAATGRVRIEEPDLRPGTERFNRNSGRDLFPAGSTTRKRNPVGGGKKQCSALTGDRDDEVS
jgi:hypothetical protein